MTVRAVFALISSAAEVAAAAFVIPAFLLNRPTTARRLMWRVACYAALFVSCIAYSGLVDGWRWWLALVGAAVWWCLTARSWRLAEVLRDAARNLDRYPHYRTSRKP